MSVAAKLESPAPGSIAPDFCKIVVVYDKSAKLRLTHKVTTYKNNVYSDSGKGIVAVSENRKSIFDADDIMNGRIFVTGNDYENNCAVVAGEPLKAVGFCIAGMENFYFTKIKQAIKDSIDAQILALNDQKNAFGDICPQM